MDQLSERQADTLKAIKDYIEANGYAPTFAEIAEAIGTTSTNYVSELLEALEQKGAIEREPRKSRAIRVIKHEEGRPST